MLHEWSRSCHVPISAKLIVEIPFKRILLFTASFFRINSSRRGGGNQNKSRTNDYISISRSHLGPHVP
jgi:hypothetical protein